MGTVQINNKCNNCWETLSNWSLANCLCMNSDKTNFMVFPSSKINGIAVLVNGHQIALFHSNSRINQVLPHIIHILRFFC